MIQTTAIIRTTTVQEKVKFVKDLILSKHDGKIFSAVNVKKDGYLREYRARLDVKAHQVGGENTNSHVESNITIYDMGLAAEIGCENIIAGKAPYRAFQMETTVMLGFRRGNVEEVYVFVDENINCQAINAAIETARTLTETTVMLVKKAIENA